jgi:hypothetical protein
VPCASSGKPSEIGSGSFGVHAESHDLAVLVTVIQTQNATRFGAAFFDNIGRGFNSAPFRSPQPALSASTTLAEWKF